MSTPPPPQIDIEHVTLAESRLEAMVSASAETEWRVVGKHAPMSSAQSKLAAAEAEHQFNVLAEQWYLDTLITSSYFDKILHPAYQKILRLDQAAIPLILRELQAMPNDWFWALRILTDEDPVKPEQAGDMQAMAEAWLAWGREGDYI
jgi:hypothetical protein